MDGTSADHSAILQRSEIRELRLARPGLATIRALRERLCQERDAQLARVGEVWPRPFRYVGERWRTQLGGSYLELGAIVELSRDQACAWSDRFQALREHEPA